jgi:adenylate kinase
MYIVFIGPPGVGKGTQASRLVDKYSMVKISTGDLLRDSIKENSHLGNRAKVYMEKGELVPDQLVLDLVKERIYSSSNGRHSYIFDGFPRTIQQAMELDRMLKEHKSEISLALEFTMDEEDRISRLSGRRICPRCQRTYHILYAQPKNDLLCDFCEIPLIQRSDDNEEVIRQRSSVYWEMTNPLLDFYSNRNILRTIDVNRSIDDIFNELDAMVSSLEKKQ